MVVMATVRGRVAGRGANSSGSAFGGCAALECRAGAAGINRCERSLSLGQEAVAIGAEDPGWAHTLQEWFDSNGRELGLKRILLTMLTLAGAGNESDVRGFMILMRGCASNSGRENTFHEAKCQDRNCSSRKYFSRFRSPVLHPLSYSVDSPSLLALSSPALSACAACLGQNPLQFYGGL